MPKLLSCVAVAAAVAGLLAGCQKQEEISTAETGYTFGPPDTHIEGNALNGLKLFKNPNLGTTGKSCDSCHPNGGQEGLKTAEITTKPLLDVEQRYPGPFSMMPEKGDMTLEEVVDACLTGPVGGKPFIKDGRDMADMLAYLHGLQSE